jgi:hypothetical protein
MLFFFDNLLSNNLCVGFYGILMRTQKDIELEETLTQYKNKSTWPVGEKTVVIRGLSISSF